MSMTIDCGTCTRHQTSSCGDCVVTFIVDREPDEAIVVDAAEFAALRRLQSAGLVPDLLHDSLEDSSLQDSSLHDSSPQDSQHDEGPMASGGGGIPAP